MWEEFKVRNSLCTARCFQKIAERGIFSTFIFPSREIFLLWTKSSLCFVVLSKIHRLLPALYMWCCKYIFTNIKSFFPVFFFGAVICILWCTIHTTRSVLGCIFLPFRKGNHLWKLCTQMYFLNKDERNPFCVQLWNASLRVFQTKARDYSEAQKPINRRLARDSFFQSAQLSVSLVIILLFCGGCVGHTSLVSLDFSRYILL